MRCRGAWTRVCLPCTREIRLSGERTDSAAPASVSTRAARYTLRVLCDCVSALSRSQRFIGTKFLLPCRARFSCGPCRRERPHAPLDLHACTVHTAPPVVCVEPSGHAGGYWFLAFVSAEIIDQPILRLYRELFLYLVHRTRTPKSPFMRVCEVRVRSQRCTRRHRSRAYAATLNIAEARARQGASCYATQSAHPLLSSVTGDSHRASLALPPCVSRDRACMGGGRYTQLQSYSLNITTRHRTGGALVQLNG